jgi:hypothetical protein
MTNEQIFKAWCMLIQVYVSGIERGTLTFELMLDEVTSLRIGCPAVYEEISMAESLTDDEKILLILKIEKSDLT